jgi:energy-coupling factor transporter ATP-binding protein EcfA2
MTNNAHAMYNVDLDQATNMIAAMGNKRTILVQGHMGTGKSSLLTALAKMFPNHLPHYFDCTTKDLGDLMLPNIKGAGLSSGSRLRGKMNPLTHEVDLLVSSDSDEQDYVTYATNEELGVHTGKPVIVMLDEFGKANPAVKQGLTCFMLERRMGKYTLHPDSIVFATTNLGGEGVGDLLVAHQRNRITVLTLKKPAHMDWIEWGINNGIDHTLLGWVKDNPHVFQSFDEVKNPDDNPYIFHPRSQRAAFVTPRSLEAASDWLKVREHLDDVSLTAALIGTVGDRAAMDLMAFVRLAEDLPSLKSIKESPETARVPASAAAVCMVVYRTLASIEADWIDAWMIYVGRLDPEAQGLFANGVRAPKYAKQGLVMTNKGFTAWARRMSHLFAADI